MKKIRALGIAPYEGIKELMDKIAIKKDDIEIVTYTANLEKGIDILRNTDKNFEVIISRGGTARLLENYIDIPVVEISFTVYDILRSIDEAKKHSKSYSIVGYPNLTNTAKELCSILDNKIEIYTTYNHESVDTTIELLKMKEVDLILADTVNYEEAIKQGMNAILITSGEESINIALNDAIKIGKVYRNLQYENSLYKSLQEIDNNIYYILNQNRNLIYNSNRYIDENMLEILQEYTATINLSEEQNYFFILNKNHYHCKIKCSYIADEILYLIRVKESGYHESLPDIESIDKKQALEDYLNSFYNITSSIGNMREQIKLASSTNKTVLLIGELGTGKTEVAKRIYSISKFSNNPLYIIDLTNMDNKKHRDLFYSPESPLFEVQSSFFIKIDKNTDPLNVNKLLTLIKNSRFAQNNKCIISYKLEFDKNKSDTLDLIMNNISTIPIFFSPLRDYKADIISLSNIYLGEKNSSSDKYILGFDKEVIDLFQRYTWPQNFIQLWRILDQLVESCNGDYISEELAKKFIQTEDNIFLLYETKNVGENKFNINLDRTLDEITKDIIKLSLIENNNNRTETAKALNISRSTIWRYLNE